MHTPDNEFSPDLLGQQLEQPNSFLSRGGTRLVLDLQKIAEQEKHAALDRSWVRVAHLRGLPAQETQMMKHLQGDWPTLRQSSPHLRPHKRRLSRLLQLVAALLVVGLLIGSFFTLNILRQGSRHANTPAGAASAGTSLCQPYALRQFPVASSPKASYLNGVSAISANDAWAVGFSAPKPASNEMTGHTLIEHWDGHKWQQVASPNAANGHGALLAVAALSMNDVWAVGGSSNGNQPATLVPTGHTLIEHWSGSSWQVVPSPNGPQGNGILKALAVVSPDDIWAVGSYNENASSPHPLVEHWNGGKWSIVTPQSDSTFVGWLNAVVAPSANELWAVGVSLSSGKQEGLVLRGNTGGWRFQTISTNQLTSISALSADNLWIATPRGSESQIEHWTGHQWQSVLSQSESLAYDLAKIVALSDNNLWVTGSSTTPNQVFPAIILHWNGQTWQPVGSPMAGADFQDLAISRSHQLWVVGDFHGSALILGQQTCP